MTDITMQGDCPVCGAFYFHALGCSACIRRISGEIAQANPGKQAIRLTQEQRREARRIAHEQQVEKRHKASRELWAELHSKQNPTPEWFAGWLSRIPRFGCACRKDFQAIIDANPPRYDDFFAWSVEAHNSVNQKLDRTIMTMEDAAAIWRKPTETTA